jgi:hypothetical protein
VTAPCKPLGHLFRFERHPSHPMTPVALARWTLLEHSRRAGNWAAVALLCAAWPAAMTFGRLGLTTRNGPLSTHAYEIAFLAALVGVATGVATLARGSWFLERADPLRRVGAEAGALVGSSALPLAAALVPALLLAPDASGARSWGFVLAVLTTVLHVGAIGLLALRLPSPPALRALLVPVLAWILPGLAGAGLAERPGTAMGHSGQLVLHVLDAARHGRLGLELWPDSAHRWRAFLPITALVGASCLLALRAPSVHALRNPR